MTTSRSLTSLRLPPRGLCVPLLAFAVVAGLSGPAIAAPENAAAPDAVPSPEAPGTGRAFGDDPAYVPRAGDPGDVRRRAGALAAAEPQAMPDDPVTGRSCIDPQAADASFAEEFDLPLDVSAWGPGTRWIAHTPWAGDFGDARFLDPGENGPFTVEHGILTIEAKRNTNGKWGSGLLASVDRNGKGFSQAYGYFEARAKLPDGPGVWPAFWLIGRNLDSKTAEIDVMEFRGAKPDGYTSSLHVWDRTGGPHDRQYERHVVFDGTHHVDRFNTYGVHVGPERTTFYFNRCPVWTAQTRPEHRQPLYVLVNLALGGSFPIDETPNPSRMEVDWVRVWPIGTVTEVPVTQ